MVAFDERLYRKTYDTVERMGADVTFVGRSVSSEESYDETAEPPPDGADLVIPGKAVETLGDPEEYAALELISSEPVTLIFVPEVMGSLPGIGSAATWAGVQRTVKSVFPIRPAGRGVAAKLILV